MTISSGNSFYLELAKTHPLSDIVLHYGDGKTIAANQVYLEDITSGKSHLLTNVEELISFIKMREEGRVGNLKLTDRVGGLPIVNITISVKGVNVGDDQLFVSTQDIPEFKIDDDGNVVELKPDEVKATLGLPRVIRVEEGGLGNFVYLKTAETANYQYYKLEDVGYYDGTDFKSLAEIKKQLVDEVDEKAIMLEVQQEFVNNFNAHEARVIAERVASEYNKKGKGSESKRKAAEKKEKTKLAIQEALKNYLKKEKANIEAEVKKRLKEKYSKIDINAILEKIPEEQRQLYLSDKYGNVVVTDIYGSIMRLIQHKVAELNLEDGTITSFKISDDRVGGFIAEKEKLTTTYSSTSYKVVDKKHKVEITRYQASAEGNYIMVTLIGQTEPIMVKVGGEYDEAELFIAKDGGAEVVQMDDLHSYIGQNLVVRINGKPYRTEPLTVTQASVRFDTVKTLQSASDKQMGDNTYLRLADGRYVKEQEFVRPIAYDYAAAGETNFDAYLFVHEESGIKIPYVVDIQTYNDAKARNRFITIDGNKIDISTAQKLKKSNKALSECAVIQTSTNNDGNYQKAVMLKVPKAGETLTEEDKKANKQMADDAYKEFLKLYQQGVYTLEELLVNDEFIELARTQHPSLSRYELVEKIVMDDLAYNSKDYQNTNFTDLKISEDGTVTGGAKFSPSKALKGYYKNWVTAFMPTLGLLASGGIFGLVAAVPVLAGFGIAAIAGLPSLLIERIRYGASKHKFSHKHKINQKALANEIETSLNQLYKDVMAKYRAICAIKRTPENAKEIDAQIANLKGSFLSSLDAIKQKMELLKESHSDASFKIVNGVAKLNGDNIELCQKHIKEIKKLAKEVKNKTKKYNKHQTEENAQALQEAKDRLNNYLAKCSEEGMKLPQAEEYDSLTKKADMLKGLIFYQCGFAFDAEYEITKKAPKIDGVVVNSASAFALLDDEKKKKALEILTGVSADSAQLDIVATFDFSQLVYDEKTGKVTIKGNKPKLTDLQIDGLTGLLGLGVSKHRYFETKPEELINTNTNKHVVSEGAADETGDTVNPENEEEVVEEEEAVEQKEPKELTATEKTKLDAVLNAIETLGRLHKSVYTKTGKIKKNVEITDEDKNEWEEAKDIIINMGGLSLLNRILETDNAKYKGGCRYKWKNANTLVLGIERARLTSAHGQLIHVIEALTGKTKGHVSAIKELPELGEVVKTESVVTTV